MEKCRLDRRDGVSIYARGTVVDDGPLYSRDIVKGMDLTCFYGKAVTLLLLPNYSYSMMDMNFQTS